MKTVKRHSNKIYMETFGCQMNKLDSELLLEEMTNRGYNLTNNSDEAGIIVYNTCSIRKHAEDRVYSYLGRLRQEKEVHPDLVVAVIGCMAQLQKDKIYQKMPHVDIVLGTTQFLQLPDLLDEARKTENLLEAYEIEDVKLDRRGSYLTSPFSAYISIIRGCSMPCTFCVVPTTRGKMVSRPIEEIVDEAKNLRDRGVVEITVLGQTVDGYGIDLYKKPSLARLLEALNEIDGLYRIRYITSHPNFITDELIRATADLDKVCEYIHMPAQSGSDRMLKHMRRGYTRKKYMRKINKIKEIMPHCGIASDFIAGYPSETEEDHRQSLSLISEAGFQNSYIFKYSRRPHTVAYDYDDDVPPSVKKRRNQELLKVQAEVSLAWKEPWLGQEVEVLVEGTSKTDDQMFSGRTRSHDIVVFPVEDNNPQDLTGKLVDVKLLRANSYTFYGRLASPAKSSPSPTPAVQRV